MTSTSMNEHLTENRLEDIRWLLGGGVSLDEALRRVGMSQDAYEKALERRR
jgi:hypothetical protein